MINDKESKIWKECKGYEKFFIVSNHGDVYSLRTNKILKVHINDNGYKVFCTRFGGRKSPSKLLIVHRMVAETFVENELDKPFVNHKNGDKLDNRSGNLEWVTAKENSIHAVENGLIPDVSGENNPSSKLTDKERLEIIRKINDEKMTQRELGKEYGVDRSTISDVKNKWYPKYLSKLEKNKTYDSEDIM